MGEFLRPHEVRSLRIIQVLGVELSDLRREEDE